MRADYGCHVRCATITDFDSFSVYDFTEGVVFREIFINQFEKLLGEVGL